MSFCSAMILVSTLLFAPSFQMRINQVKELALESSGDAQDNTDLAGGLGPEGDKQDMKLTLERLRQRYADLELTSDFPEVGKDRLKKATKAVKKTAALAKDHGKPVEDKAKTTAKKEKASGRAQKVAQSKETVDGIAPEKGASKTVSKASGDARPAADKSRAKAKKEEKTKQNGKNAAADQAPSEVASAKKLAAKKIVAKAGGDAPKAVVEAARSATGKQDMELTLERLRQRYAKPELIQAAPEQAQDSPTKASQAVKRSTAKINSKGSGADRQTLKPAVAKAEGSEPQREQKLSTKAKVAAKKRAAEADDNTSPAEDQAIESAKKEKKVLHLIERHTKKAATDRATVGKVAAENPGVEKIVAKAGGGAPKTVANAAGPKAEKQDIERTLKLLRQRYAKPQLIEGSPEEQLHQAPKVKQMANKAEAKVDGNIKQTENKLTANAKKKANALHKATYFEETQGRGLDKKEHAQTVTKAKGSKSPEEQAAAPITAAVATKKRAAKIDDDARPAKHRTGDMAMKEENAKHHAQKAGAYSTAASKIAAGKPVTKKSVAKAAGNVPKAVSVAVKPEADKQDIEMTLERLRQRYATPELLLDSQKQKKKDQPTRVTREKQMSKQLEVKVDGDAKQVEGKANAKAKKERSNGDAKKAASAGEVVSNLAARAKQMPKKQTVKAEKEEKTKEPVKRATADKAIIEKAGSKKPQAKKSAFEVDSPKTVAKAVGPEADKQDMQRTLERLRQRYAKPELIYDTKIVEAGRDAPKAVPFSKRMPRRKEPTVTK